MVLVFCGFGILAVGCSSLGFGFWVWGLRPVSVTLSANARPEHASTAMTPLMLLQQINHRDPYRGRGRGGKGP